MSRLLYLFLTAAVLTGCSTAPKVVTEMDETLPAKRPSDVVIYETNDIMPDDARRIGKVKVTDGGFTPTRNCQYGSMLALAVRKAAENGANALHIDEHKAPDLRSTCHRIWGTMYVVSDSIVRNTAQVSLREMEEKKDAELWEQYQEEIDRQQKTRANNPKNVVKLSAGVSWITSEFQTPYGTYRSRAGYGLNASYQHLWDSGLGFGIDYLFYDTSFGNGIGQKINYIGPSIVFGYTTYDNQWRFDGSLGIGYANYKEETNNPHMAYIYTLSRVGVNVALGAEYRIAKHLGIGMQMNTFTLPLKRPEGYDTSKYNFYGIRHLDIMGGLRIYL